MMYSPNAKAVSVNITRFSSIGNGGGTTGPGGGGPGAANPLMLKSKRIAVLRFLFRKIFMFYNSNKSILLNNNRIF
jgi:hypothetical protein